jgi:hypothetical protein
VQRTYARLRDARVGAAIATFYGSSGRVPSTYELVHLEAAGAGWLRLWTKRDAVDNGSFFIEVGEKVVLHDKSGRSR